MSSLTDALDFFKELDISATADIDEIPNQFARILSWFPIESFLEPTILELRIILKATLYMYASLSAHGHKLEEKLKTTETIPKNVLSSLLTNFNNGTLLQDVCKQLLMTTTGPNHILEIQDFCNDFLDAQRYYEILAEAREVRRCRTTDSPVATEARFLLTTTFHLPSEKDIETAIQRIVDNVKFEVLAWIVNYDGRHTYFAMKCEIIQNEICSRLENGAISDHFLSTMFEFVALDEFGLKTYLICLKNHMFARSLISFFIRFLSTLEDTSSDNNKQTRLKELDRDQVSFLIAAMLSRNSDCRIDFHKKLAGMDINVNVLLNINHLNLVYDF